ncbi:beta-galactosidase trimerization domain-containing protein [Streptomyces sp. D2-8]|uniref:beta-galactosidase trimerization domain-containing protein n=1 Tax=Streptomyces sp. D2-8 TaxID=2707767 RepID=UPI0027E3C343|nr:beta-galactosidase trimerization domain-containing protein [Streptomyces sp. D2-8]
MRDPLPVTGTDSLPLPPGAHALHWADGLRPQGAETLAAYAHPHFGRWPAVTTHRHGAGRVTYVGTVPDPASPAPCSTGTPRTVPGARPTRASRRRPRPPGTASGCASCTTGRGRRCPCRCRRRCGTRCRAPRAPTRCPSGRGT